MAKSSTVSYIKRKKRAGGYRKKRVVRTKSNESRIVHLHTRNQMPLPKAITTSFVLEFAGLWDTTGAAIFDPYLNNSLSTLLSTGAGPLFCGNAANRHYGSTPGAGNAFNVTVSTQPAGFASFIPFTTGGQGLYNRYCVTGVHYAATVNPQTQADQCQLIVLPEINAYTAASKYTNLAEMQQAPYAKDKRCTGNNTVAGNTVSGYISLSKLLGISKQKLLTDTSYSGYCDSSGIVVPAVNVNLIMAARNNLGAVYPSKLPYGLRLKYYVTLMQEAGKMLTD